MAMLCVSKIAFCAFFGALGARVEVDLDLDLVTETDPASYESMLESADLDDAIALVKRAQSGVVEVIVQGTDMFLAHLANATVSSDTLSGACTAQDVQALQAIGSHNDPHHHKGEGSLGERLNDCGHKSFHLFSGFNKDKMAKCSGKALGISAPCAQCYAAAGSYGCKHCKGACMFSWCSRGCLDCTRPSKVTLFTCLVGSALGETVPHAEEC